MDKNQISRTGLQCLQLLFQQVRRNVNFPSLLTAEVLKDYQEKPLETLETLSAAQRLAPEQITTLETLQFYNGPVILERTDGAWFLLPNSSALKNTAGNTPLVSPADAAAMVQVPVKAVLEKATGKGLIFRNLAQVDAKKQTRLTAFVQIARHHNAQADIREIMHEFAVGEEEVRDNLFFEIVSRYGFKAKKVHLAWKDLEKSSTIFPCIAEKKSGKFSVLCGMKKVSDTETQIVLLDPESPQYNMPEKFLFLSQQDFEKEYTGKFILLKKVYSLSDEEQPFSLRWFIPEFIKNKGIFGQIALMVVMLTIFSLIVPLFFQIVVDKVLVNQAYNTLNVIGVGILLAIIFNALVSFVRSYLLLFATNKIDISTATKTFTHLMRLPVDFFDRVPSGVLLKHMQQTEKIRGFLSGNLFFTILDLFALCIFIPFLLFYSPVLTGIVLGFSLLMALVIACLIKPFQKRLDELYQAEGKRQSMLVESIHGIKTVKSLALEPVERKIWDDSTAYAIKSYFRVGKISMTAQSIS